MNQPYRPGSSEYLKLLGYKRYHYLAWPQVSSTRLVLLHGRGESADIWTGFANQFIRYADTIAIDLRGHGGTPWDPDMVYGFDDFVDLGHDADGLAEGDDDRLVVVDVLVGQHAAEAGVLAALGLAVLEPFLADLVAADVEVPDIVRYVSKI